MVSDHYSNTPKNEQVIFCGPPPARASKKRLTKWQRIADTVKTRPGEWAYVGEQNKSTAWRINNSQIKAMRDGIWQAVSRPTGYPDRSEVWVRYLGETDLFAQVERLNNQRAEVAA